MKAAKFEHPQDEINRLQELLKLEKETEKSFFKSLLLEKSPKQRRESGLTWYPVSIKETGFGLGDHPFVVIERHDSQSHQLQSGQTVRLFSHREGRDIQESQGTIHHVHRQEMKVTLYADEHPDWLHDGKVGVDMLFDERSYREMEKALNEIAKPTDPIHTKLRDILLGYTSPAPATYHTTQIQPYNPSQSQAIQMAASDQLVTIVHGPPGTGKTTTLIGIMQQLAKLNHKMLVCAPSNAAVDLLTARANAAGLTTLRVGHLSRIDTSLYPLTLEGALESHPQAKQVKKLKKQVAEIRRMAGKYKRQFGKEEREERKQMYREARAIAQQAIQLEEHLIQNLLDQAQVVTATLVGSKSHYLHKIPFDTVLIDEAAQALEPATWIAILKAKKVILAGDPHQLPPTVKQDPPHQQEFAISLMEKTIQRQPQLSALLQTQYRMHATIMGFSNDWFYQGKLEAHPSVAQRSLPQAGPVLEFVDTAGCGYEDAQESESLSLLNDGERGLLWRHLQALEASITTGPISVGVISPYKAQVKQLQQEIETKTSGFTKLQINISTVDSFQGQEQDIIYLSLVRSNPDSQIGFLKDHRRMNVAMTRAKMKLVVIGDSATIAQDPFFQAFLTYCDQHHAYRTAWEWI